MALVLKDRVLETCAAPGAGVVTLLGPVTGYQAFSSVGNGNTCYYAIADQNGANWEVGIGTYATSGNTLTRTTILSSSNSGSTVNFSSGIQNIFLTYPSERSVNLSSAALTLNRVTYATTDGLLTDSANLTFNGSTLGVTGTAAVTGTVAVTGALTATLDSTFSSTGALLISKGTTAQQPASPVTGMLRYNTTSTQFEGYGGATPGWNSVGGAALSNDTTTASFEYPLFAATTSGTATTVYTSNAKLLYKPSTGEFQSSELIAGNGLILNNATVATSYTIANGTNAMSVGPITVATGQTVTVSSGSRWVVL
jgi:hypothetical protein